MPDVLEQQPLQPLEEKAEQPVKKNAKKKRRGAVRAVIAIAVIAALAAGGYFLFGKEEEASGEVITDFVSYGSISSMVEGSGLTKAKNSQTITLSTACTVQEVFVTEGQTVMAGDPLFVVDSEAAKLAVEKARKDVEGYEKQLSVLHEDIAGLNLSPSYPGKLLEVVNLYPGDIISKGQRVATLADDTRLRLQQYFSYAYAGELWEGQEVEVSIPALMTTLPGRVEKVHMVSRITPEGSKLFSAEIVVDNPGTLTAEMVATATTMVDGEMVYPYEAGTLEYYRVGELCSTVNGEVISSALVDYLQVTAGQVLVQIDGESSEGEIFALEQSLEEANKVLDTAMQNLENCNATAPIDGTVIGLVLMPGMELEANTAVVTIADTATITVDAMVDERNIGYVQPGMMVNIDQWGSIYTGIVESVSLNSTVENGMAAYPMVVSVDNYDGGLMTGSYINYSLIASQNDNCLVVPIQCVKTIPLDDGTVTEAVFVRGARPENAVDFDASADGVPEGFWAVPVETGIADDYYVEIKSGVEEGMEVFTQVKTMDVWM